MRRKRNTWTEEGTFYVTYPGCTGTQSSVHISWLLPQDSQIISLPWHGTSSTALGCLTEHDIASVCVHMCVLQRGPNLNPSAPPADCKPSGPPCHSSQLPHFVNMPYDAVDKRKLHFHKVAVDTIECISTINPALRLDFILLSCSCVDCKPM